MIAIGGTNIIKAYLGQTELANIAIGDELLLSSEPLPYLKFTALEDGTFSYAQPLQYSLDEGLTWVALAANTQSPTVTAGNTIMWKGTYTPSGTGNIFSSTGTFNADGDPRSVYAGDNFLTASIVTRSFSNMFAGSKIVDASGLLMSYQQLSNLCCNEMFKNCKELTLPPALPAMNLANNCYSSMFYGCSAMTNTPALPALTLYQNCYEQMFMLCTSIIIAPVLPATTLVRACYYYMFARCSKINYIKAMFTSDPTSVSLSTTGWVGSVATSGTFVKNAAATWTTTGNNGVPTGWTTETASE